MDAWPDAVHALGLRLRSPLGLAAGYDRHGDHLPELAAGGFGFAELGTVTPHPVAQHNPGVAALAARVQAFRAAGATHLGTFAVGISVACDPGLDRVDCPRSYAAAVRAAWPAADYVVLNFTARWTSALLQDPSWTVFTAVLEVAATEAARLASGQRRAVALVAKVPLWRCLADEGRVARAIAEAGFAGILASAQDEAEQRRLPRSVAAGYGELSAAVAGRLEVLAVGGVTCAQDVTLRLRHGVRLVQVFSAYATGGTDWLSRMTRDLAAPRALAAAEGC